VDVGLILYCQESLVSACREPVWTNREDSGLVTRFGMLTAPRSTVVQPSPFTPG
jgi:hypothetical protein